MEMRAGCRLPRSGLFPLNLNLNLARRSRGLGRAEGGREGLAARPLQAPGTPPGLGGLWAPSGFCALSRGELGSGEPRGFCFHPSKNAGKSRSSTVSAVPVSTGLPGTRL